MSDLSEAMKRQAAGTFERAIRALQKENPGLADSTKKVFVSIPAAHGQPPRNRTELSVMGIKLLSRDYVPSGEAWLVDEEGNVLQKIKIGEAK